MKKTTLIIAAAFTMAGLASCNRTAQDPEFTTYTLTVEASKDALAIRALELNGRTLNMIWGEDDEVIVLKGTSKIGTLVPQSTGSASAVLKGSVTTSGLSSGTRLTLITPRNTWKYTSQDGTLDLLSSDYDYATADITVSSVNGSNVEASAASFENQQAIVMFTLLDASGRAINVDELEITAENNKLVREFKVSGGAYTPVYGSLSIIPESPSSVLYVAIRNDYSGKDTFTLNASSGKKKYTTRKEAVVFENGKFYGGKVKMTEIVDTYTIAGSPEDLFGSYWNPEDTNNDLIPQSDGTYKSKTYYVTSDPTSIAFKVVKNHAYANGEWPSSNYTLTAGKGPFYIVFNPSNGNITPTYTTSTGKNTYTVAGTPASVFGEEWNPAYTANDMTGQTDGTVAKTFANVPRNTELHFKVCVNHGWSECYGAANSSLSGDSDGNCVYTTTSAGNVTIKFNPSTKQITVQ